MFKYALLGAVGALGFADTATAAIGDPCTQAEYQGAASQDEVTAWGVGTVHYKLSGSGEGLGCKAEDPGTGSWTAVRFYQILGFEEWEKYGTLGCFAEIAYCDGDGAKTSCLSYDRKEDHQDYRGDYVEFYTAMSNGKTPLQHCQPNTATDFATYGGQNSEYGGSERQADAYCAANTDIPLRATCLDTTGAPTNTPSGSESSHSSDSSDSNHACHPTTVVKFTGFTDDQKAYTITVDGDTQAEVPGATDFNVCKDFSIERTFSGHALSITGLSPAVSGWSDLGKSNYSGEVGTTYSYKCLAHPDDMKGTICLLYTSPSPRD